MSTITIALPGSLWPADAGDAPYDGLALPALRGGLSRIPAAQILDVLCWSGWLGALLLGAAADAPYAACAAAAHGLEGEGTWLRADPAHCTAGREDVALTAMIGDLSVTESTALIAALNAHFEQDNVRFHAISASQWLMHSEAALDLRTVDPWGAMNVPARFVPITGNDARRLRQIMTEAQMLLFTHPINEARAARTALPVNCVWPWASGSQLKPKLAQSAPQVFALFSDCRQAQMLGEALSIAVNPSTANCENIVAFYPTLMASYLRGDGEVWRESFAALVAQKIAPLLLAKHQISFVLGGQRPTHLLRWQPAQGLAAFWQSITGGGAKPAEIFASLSAPQV